MSITSIFDYLESTSANAFKGWLALSSVELSKLGSINDLIKLNQTVEAQMTLASLDLTTLIKYTELSTAVKNFCSKNEQSFIWRKHLQDMSQESYSIKEYSPLAVSEQVKGIYYYWQAAEIRSTEKKRFGGNELIFLMKSAENHCFYAYNSLSTWAYEKYKKGTSDYSLFAVEIAKAASEFHWTPGYLLLYKTYLNLAILNDSSSILYQHALEILLVAKKISEHADSINAINNAYFGKGLIAGNKGEFASWEDAIQQTISKGKIPTTIVNDIYTRAANSSKKILTDFKSIESDELNNDSLNCF